MKFEWGGRYEWSAPVVKFDPDQPRDERGRWVDAAGGTIHQSSETTNAEDDAIHFYTSHGDAMINGALRAGGPIPYNVKGSIEALDSAMKRSVVEEDLVVYRGLSRSSETARSILSGGVVVGQDVRQLHYQSTSQDDDIARRFGSRVRWEITVPKGTNLIKVENSGALDDEQEIILPRGGSYKITAISRDESDPKFPKVRLKAIYQQQGVTKSADRSDDDGFFVGQIIPLPGYELVTLAVIRKFNPDQPRDGWGRWTDAVGGGSINQTSSYTKDEKDTLDSYMTYAGAINGALRMGSTGDAHMTASIATLDAALKKSVVEEDIVVHRGVEAGSQTGRAIREGARGNVGEIITQLGYQSTSSERDTARGFGARVMLEITVPKGTNAIRMPDSDEDEILLPRGGSYKITAVERGEDARLGKTVRLKAIYQQGVTKSFEWVDRADDGFFVGQVIPLPGYELVKLAVIRKAFDPDQPRDEAGRWTAGGGVEGLSADTSGRDFNQMNTALARGNFKLRLGRVRDAWGSKNSEVIVGFNDIPSTWSSVERSGGRFQYYDPEAHTLEDGRPIPKSRDDDLPAKGEPGLIYRGMSYDEYKEAIGRGFFKSKGDYNIGDAQIGLTYFSPDPQTASSYASGFAPWQYMATPSRPAVVVAIKDPGDHVIMQHIQGEIGLRGEIPTSIIDHVYLGKPIGMTEGTFDVIEDKYAKPKVGSSFSPSASIRWKRTEVVKAFDPDQPRDDHGRWTDGGGMTSDEASSIVGRYSYKNDPASSVFNAYFGSMHAKFLNLYLRTGGKDPELERVSHWDWSDKISKLTTAFAEAAKPIDRDVVVYRGIHGEAASKLFSDNVGSIIVDKAFVSTTLDRDWAYEFASENSDGRIVSIRVPKGTKVLGGLGLESELLLGTNTKFKVISPKELEVVP